MRTIRLVLILAFISSLPPMASGNIIYDFTLNTSPLIGHVAGPFSLDFQLNDGSGSGDANNAVMLSDFVFGAGGAAAGSPVLQGGAAGTLTSGVSITDSGFLNEFTQSFTPGSQLGFRMSLSTNVDVGPTPDAFSFAILDRGGAEIPTMSFFDVFVDIDIDSTAPTVQTFRSDTSRSPVAGGGPIDIAAPVATAVPEPGAIPVLGVLLGALLVTSRRHVFR